MDNIFFYKISLYLNILKYRLRFIFKNTNNNENIVFLKKYFNNKKKGIYIDVGAYHPIRLSNTMFLYDKGWKGINIDISKKSIDLFNLVRPRDINLNIAIGYKNLFTKFYFSKDLSPINSLDKKFFRQMTNKKIKTKKIEMVTLDSVLKKYIPRKKINLIDVDVEGNDLEVLKGLNLKKNKIELIMIEAHGYNRKMKEKAKKISKILKKNNFQIINGTIPGNCIFKNIDFKQKNK